MGKRSRQGSVSSPEDPNSPSTRECSVDIKIMQLEPASVVPAESAVMRCLLPPHKPLYFETFEAYEKHHRQDHTNRCTECLKNFPDEHLLHLHIVENHDPFVEARRAKGEKTYGCLVPGCERFCSTPMKRRLHCIDKHHFPRNFDFFIVKDGIDGRTDLLRPPYRPRSGTLSSEQESKSAPGHHTRESTTSEGVEDMDVVKENEEEDGTRHERAPIQLKGRGGFGHPRGPMRARGMGRGRGQGQGGDRGGATDKAPSDPMDTLTSSMAALQFIPHSVHMARARARGRGA